MVVITAAIRYQHVPELDRIKAEVVKLIFSLKPKITALFHTYYSCGGVFHATENGWEKRKIAKTGKIWRKHWRRWLISFDLQQINFSVTSRTSKYKLQISNYFYTQLKKFVLNSCIKFLLLFSDKKNPWNKYTTCLLQFSLERNWFKK